jgi:hypothetical protein
MAMAQRKREIRVKIFKGPDKYPIKETVRANNPTRAKADMTMRSVQTPLTNPV